MQTRIRAVLYDFDGVIQDSMAEEYKGCVAVFKAAGLEPPSLSCFCQKLTMPFSEWFKSYGVNMPWDELQLIYHAHVNKRLPPLFPGVVETMIRLKEARIKQGVVSASGWITLRDNLARHDLIKYLDVALGESENKTRAIIQACKDMDVPVEQTLYVGDLTSDIRDGKLAGVLTAAFIGPNGDSKVFNEVRPDFKVLSHNALACMILGF
ncbi:MAG: HAD family hydrolase [Patescibacteria group bacterium]|jgi:phosphoglycolate phosphatase-like HAD superfamily hydrolase